MASLMYAAMAALGVLAVGASPSICGADPTKVADCDHPDYGSCGNACCLVSMDSLQTPEATYKELKALLASNIDGTFSYVTGGDPNPGDDLRQYNISKPKPFQFILQGRHDAPKFHGENGDIIDINIAATATGSSIRMFSLSRIHGALGDAGQNYKSLAFIKESLKGAYGELTVLHGCGKSMDAGAIVV
uniref:Uncharacterized protein n=1 Tax=Pfiesteria piscicida TaxID=71001 RepID=A3E3Q9_PFIPI|nr:unknown [Pfiesteria piscicida]